MALAVLGVYEGDYLSSVLLKALYSYTVGGGDVNVPQYSAVVGPLHQREPSPWFSLLTDRANVPLVMTGINVKVPRVTYDGIGCLILLN